MDRGDLGLGQRRPFGRRARLRAVANAVEAVLGGVAIGLARHRAEHGQVAVELRAVGVDDHPAGAPRKLKRERALAAGGRTGNEGEGRKRLGHCHADSSRTTG